MTGYALNLEGSRLKKATTIWVQLHVDIQQPNGETVQEAREDMTLLRSEVGVTLGNKEGKLEKSLVVLGTAKDSDMQTSALEFGILSLRLEKLKPENLEPIIGIIDEIAKVSVWNSALVIISANIKH